MLKKLLFSILPLLAIGCGDNNVEKKLNGRWYTQSQVDRGRIVFAESCAQCHGKSAQGTFNWKQALPDGSFPPPPLNGSAHAWHHSLSILKRTINNGGIPLGGTMPPFKDKLSESDKDAVIAFFQNYWNDDIYRAWIKADGLK